MQKSMAVTTLLAIIVLAACAPDPWLGPLFGPGSGAALLVLAALGGGAYAIWLRGRHRPGRRSRHGGRSEDSDSAVRILRERYANGDISRTDYLQALEDLVQR